MIALLLTMMLTPAIADDPAVVLPGQGANAKHVVLISGDEEYRSEEVMSQLGRILHTHGFKCTVLFSIDPEGFVNPNRSNIPGLEALKTADLMCIFTRFRNLPDEQMQHVHDFIESGKPVLGLRTATHAFANNKNPKFSKYNWNSKEKGWAGGFGKVILGETWVSHHGKHGIEGTRGRINKDQGKSPLLHGIQDGDIFGSSDVYTATPPADATILLNGEVTDSLQPKSNAVAGRKNEPMMPITWIREYKKARIFTTTMGSGYDFVCEGTRRMIVNGCFWCLGLDVPGKANVDLVGTYQGSHFGNKSDDFWKSRARKPVDFFK